jgi:hypothetical protein
MVFGSIGDIFFQWNNLGLFDIVLPFLLVFAIVFGLLSSTHFFGDNRSVYVIIAIVIGLISLRFTDLFTVFISELFPRLGVGIAVILTVLILAGLFINKDEKRYWGWGLSVLGLVIAIAIIYQSFDAIGLSQGIFGNTDTIGFIVLAILIIGVIIAVSASKSGGGGSRGGDIDWLPYRRSNHP